MSPILFASVSFGLQFQNRPLQSLGKPLSLLADLVVVGRQFFPFGINPVSVALQLLPGRAELRELRPNRFVLKGEFFPGPCQFRFFLSQCSFK